MHRWHLLRWHGWQLALHKIRRSDDDRALHDHSGDNLSIILKGEYTEILDVIYGTGQVYGPGNVRFRKAEMPHRLVLNEGQPVWTIWLRWPPRRQWGFHCPRGWRSWKDYVAEADYSKPGSTSTVGKGCD